jgi:hypothetical protein
LRALLDEIAIRCGYRPGPRGAPYCGAAGAAALAEDWPSAFERAAATR